MPPARRPVAGSATPADASAAATLRWVPRGSARAGSFAATIFSMLGTPSHSISKRSGLAGSIETGISMPRTSHRSSPSLTRRATQIRPFLPPSTRIVTFPRPAFPQREAPETGGSASITSAVARIPAPLPVSRCRPKATLAILAPAWERWTKGVAPSRLWPAVSGPPKESHFAPPKTGTHSCHQHWASNRDPRARFPDLRVRPAAAVRSVIGGASSNPRDRDRHLSG